MESGNPVASCGAINRVAGGSKGVWFVGSVNGGVWRTSNLYGSPTHWEPVTDNQPVTCASIVALAVSDWNPSLVLAGCGGSTSSEMGNDWNTYNNGDWGGVMISVDGGNTWKMTNFPENYYVTDILILQNSVLLVSALSHFFNAYDGGIWVSKDLGTTWTRTFTTQTYDLILLPSTGQIFASLAYDTSTVWTSINEGQTWQNYSTGLTYEKYVPFYTRLAIQTILNPPLLFLSTLLNNPANISDTFSNVFVTNIQNGTGNWKIVPGQPVSLDQDAMPKDKLAVLADPEQANIIYIAANAGFNCKLTGDDYCNLVFRIDWQNGTWIWMDDKSDTVDGTQPHPDMRDLAWDYNTGNLLLTDDGGIHVRISPKTNQGKWIGVCGDIGEMEMISASYDNRLDRWIGGSQDNDVQILPPNSTNLLSSGSLGCDGTQTLIDNVHCPARMFSSCQFLAEFSLWYGNPLVTVSIPIAERYFTDAQGFPYFVSAVNLNSQNPNQLVFPVNGTFGTPSGFYQITIPDNLNNSIPPPQLLFSIPDNAAIYDLVVGGYTNNQSNLNFIFALNNTHFFKWINNTLTITLLPSIFADPVHLTEYINNFTVPILGPLAHGRTASIAVSPADSNIIAITGWPVNLNNGQEFVWLSFNEGRSWTEITGNLYTAVGTIGKIRPESIYIIEFSDLGYNAILVGTVNGIFLTWTDSKFIGLWSRLGINDMPLVLVLGISYDPYSDTLVAATFGRGVYYQRQAKSALLTNRAQQIAGNCQASNTNPVTSSAKFFPKQQSC